MASEELAKAPTILVVDDDPAFRRAMVRLLESECGMGCVVHESADGGEAREVLTGGGGTMAFDCVFLDYQMPGEDGLAVLHAARAGGVVTPIVILTGEGNEELAVEMMKAGATDYLVKGHVTPDVLGRTLRHALRLGEAESRAAAAEARRRESEERFRRLVEVAEDGVWVLDAEGRTDFVNAAAAAMIGYTAEELIGRSPTEFMADEVSRQTTLAGLARRRLGFRERRECAFRHRDGSMVWAIVSAAPLTGSGGEYRGSFGVLTDVTHQKQTEQALRESEERFRRVFEEGPVGMAMTGLDRRMIAANAAFGRFLGRDPKSLVGTRFDEITHPEDVTKNADFAERMRAGELNSYRFEKRYVRPDGEVVWGELTASVIRDTGGRPAYMLSIVEDVTERRAANEALRASEGRFRLLFESSPVAIAMAIRGVTHYANPAYLRMFGYDGESEVVGRSLLEQVAPSARADVAERIVRRERGEVLSDEYETTGVRQDGSEFPYQVRVGRMDLPEGPANILFLTDLTERRRQEREVAEAARLREQLAQVQKMESLGRLAGGIAHDFNNLLAVIAGYAESLERRIGDAEPGRTHVAEIGRAAERGARLVKQLTAFSRSKPVKTERVDVAECVAGVCQMLRGVMGERIGVERHGDGRPAVVEADPGQVEQMIVNLALNARDAMTEGGKLTFETAIYEGRRPEGAQAEGHRRWVVLAVSDTGRGMDEATRAHIFEPFFTTRREGTGLGLSIVYGIVQQQGGHISVFSEPGKGTRFEVFLPAAGAG